MRLNKIQKTFVKYFSDSIEEIEECFFTRLHENDQIEFKKSLVANKQSINKSYLKTIAGFANHKGGWMIFGVEPDENEVIGIKAKYNNLDNVVVSTSIREGIDGTFGYDFFTAKIKNKVIGFLKIEKALNPPVIVKQNHQENGVNLQTGDIFYRYSAQTARISATDLHHIIDEEISKKSKAFLSKVQQIIKIGTENTALLNTNTGEIDADKSNVKLILSEDILSKINLIEEGKIVKKDGAPAYVVKGNIESIIQPTKIIEKQVTTGIRAKDYYSCFFSFRCPNPKVYLKELLYRETHYYPIYFFMQKAKLTVEETIKFLESINEHEVKNNIKKNLIERLRLGDVYTELGALIDSIDEDQVLEIEDIQSQINDIADEYNLKGKRDKTIIRTIIVNMLRKKIPIPIEIIEFSPIEVIQAFSHLEDSFIKKNKQFVLNELQKVYSTINCSNCASYFRKILCLYDYVLFGKLGG